MDKLNMFNNILERLNATEYTLQKTKESFSDYDASALTEAELKAVLAKAVYISAYVKHETTAMLAVLDRGDE